MEHVSSAFTLGYTGDDKIGDPPRSRPSFLEDFYLVQKIPSCAILRSIMGIDNLPYSTLSPTTTSFHQWLQSMREKKYRSARDFCSQVNIGVSYPQYSRFESGDQLPSLALAIRLAQLFGVSAVEATLIWGFAQLKSQKEEKFSVEISDYYTSHFQKEFSSIPAQSVFQKTNTTVDDSIVFNRAHKALFQKSPIYRDIFCLVNAFGDEGVETKILKTKFNELTLETLQSCLDELYTLGVLELEGDRVKVGKRLFYFPDNAEFFELRNSNFQHNFQKLFSKLSVENISNRKLYRGLITRDLTENQFKMFLEKFDGLLAEILNYRENSRKSVPVASEIQKSDPKSVYSVCVLAGPRFEDILKISKPIQGD